MRPVTFGSVRRILGRSDAGREAAKALLHPLLSRSEGRLHLHAFAPLSIHLTTSPAPCPLPAPSRLLATQQQRCS
jgi:hypothetical protein